MHRTDDAIVVDKPSGLFVHRSDFDRRVTDVLLTRVRDAIGARVHPVHRLDRGASGLVLFALTPEAARHWQDALTLGTKTYLALVRGAGPLSRTIDRPLRPPGKQRTVDARTEVERLVAWETHGCALVVARPRTGRFHQIRRHLAGIGRPLLIDSSHGDTRLSPVWRNRGLSRLFLHCARLELAGLDVRCALPADLQSVLAGLGTPTVGQDALDTVLEDPCQHGSNGSTPGSSAPPVGGAGPSSSS